MLLRLSMATIGCWAGLETTRYGAVPGLGCLWWLLVVWREGELRLLSQTTEIHLGVRAGAHWRGGGGWR